MNLDQIFDEFESMDTLLELVKTLSPELLMELLECLTQSSNAVPTLLLHHKRYDELVIIIVRRLLDEFPDYFMDEHFYGVVHYFQKDLKKVLIDLPELACKIEN